MRSGKPQAVLPKEPLGAPEFPSGAPPGEILMAAKPGFNWSDPLGLEEELTNRGAKIKRYRKPTFTKPAPHDLRQQIASECAAVVEALAD